MEDKEKFADFLQEELENRKIDFSSKAIYEAAENYEKDAAEIQKIMFENDDRYKDITLQSDFAFVNIVRNCIRFSKNKLKK